MLTLRKTGICSTSDPSDPKIRVEARIFFCVGNLKNGSEGSEGSAHLLPATRDLYSRRPETYLLEPWELQHVLFSRNYVDDLADEGEIAAAVEVARTDWPQWRRAA